MKLLNLILIMLLSVAMLTGCGGGGGGGNPAGPAEDPLTDYPTIAASYNTMEAQMVDNSGDATTRTNNFMLNISNDFRNMDNVAGKFNDLKTVTQSRLERYDFNSYAMTPTSHSVGLDGNVVVVTTLLVNVKLKAGQTGSAPQNTNIYLYDVPITWKNEAGTWKIIKGLPYTSNEYWNLAD